MDELAARGSFWRTLSAQWHSTLGRRLLQGASWSVIGGGIFSASSLLSAILVARMLGPEQFGALGLVQSTLNTFIIFVAPAVGLTATKFIAEVREYRPRRAGRILGLTMAAAFAISGALALGMVLGAEYLAEGVCQARYLAPLLRIAAAALFLTGINGAQTGALAGIEAFGSIAVANIVKGLALLPLMWLGTHYLGIHGAVLALVLAALIACGLADLLLRRALRRAGLAISFRGLRPYAGLLMTFSFPAMLTSGMVLFAMWLGNVLLVRSANGYFELGIFNAANQWRAAILFLPGMIVQPLLPVLASLAGAGHVLQFRKVLTANVAVSSLAALVTSLAAIFFSNQIMAAYGPAFSHGRLTMVLVVVATLLASPTMAIIQAMNSLGELWASAAIHFLWVIVFLATLGLMVGQGARGLGTAYVVSYLVQLFVFALYVRFRLHRYAIA